MNILHLQTELNLTCGVTKNIYLIMKNSSSTEKHFVMCFGGDAVTKFNSINIRPLILKGSSKNIIGIIKIFSELLRFCKLNNVNIIHSHHRFFDFVANIIGKFQNFHTVMSVQSKTYGIKFFSYRSEILIACSNSIRNHLISYFGIQRNKISLIHNFIDEDEILISKNHELIKRELGFSNSDFIIGFIGRFDIKEKGIDLLLEAFNNILEIEPEFKLLLIGKGCDEKYVNEYSTDNNLPVIIMSPRIDIYNYYNICNLIILPSRVEPFSLTALESGVMKKPVIASKVDGNMELITHEQNGLLFENGNSYSLANNILRVFKDSVLRKKISFNLNLTVKEKYSKKQQLEKYHNLYRSLK